MATCTIDGLRDLLADAGVATPVPDFPGADLAHNPQDIFRAYLAHRLQKLVDCEAEVAYAAVDGSNVTGMGDLVIVSPRLRLKNTKPKDLVVDLASKLPTSPPFGATFPDGIHLRVFSSPNVLPRLLLPYIRDRGAAYGYDDSLSLVDPKAPQGPHKKVVVEFSSPNLAEDFGPRHLRSTLIGASVANLYARLGWNVVRMNYLGDWGKHIGLLASGWARFGSDEEFAKDPMRHMTDVFHKIQELFKPEEEASKAAKAENKDTAEIESQGIYAERNSFFKRMEDRDQEAIDLWQRFRDASIEYYKGSYAKLGIQFDEYSGESTYSAESVAEIESKLKDNGVYEESDGSWIIDFAKHGSRGLGVAVVRYRNGTTSYLLRDIAAVLDRHKAHGFDKMIYVAAMELDNYFQRVIRTLQLIDKADIAAKLQHVNFAKMTGIPEQLASARLLDDYIVGCAEMMREHMPSEGAEDVYVTPSDDVVTNLGLSALVAQDFCRKKSGAVPFDVARMTAFDGETGPAFQNCYARLLKLLGQQPPVTDYATLDYSQLEGADHSELLRTISQYPDAVSAMYRNMEPTGIMMYAFRLVDQLMYTIDDETCDWASEDDGTRARLALYETARIVLESALTLLGITPLSQ